MHVQVAKPAGTARAVARSSAVVTRAAARSNWLPGSDFPAHLEQSKLPGCFGFDPLGLGADPERLVWFAEAERVHSRWAMLGVAGILLLVRRCGLGGLWAARAVGCGLCLCCQCHRASFNSTNGRPCRLSARCPPLQEITNPNLFWYTAPTQIELPFDITGLVFFELVVMHVSR